MKDTLQRWLLPLLLGLLASAAAGADPMPADLNPTLQPILAKHTLPGLIAAVVDGDKISAIGAVGVRKVGSPEKITVDDQIHLGSDTKAMTALLIGQLIENKQLTFDTPMDHIFPDLAAGMKPAAAKITVRQLLDHTSGLPANAPNWSAYARNGDSLPAQRRAAVKELLAADPTQAPGTKFVYSNAGYVVLGTILEQKTGLPWEELIKEKLFTPLKMTSAGFGTPGTLGKIDQPWGHTLDGATLKPIQSDNPAVMSPAGRVHCTISDWAKFISLFLQPQPNRPKLLDSAILKQLISPRPGMTYAGGWITATRDWGGTVLTHAGSNTMWYCVAWLAPEKDFAVLVATNVGGDDASTACDEAAWAAIQFHLNTTKARP